MDNVAGIEIESVIMTLGLTLHLAGFSVLVKLKFFNENFATNWASTIFLMAFLNILAHKRPCRVRALHGGSPLFYFCFEVVATLLIADTIMNTLWMVNLATLFFVWDTARQLLISYAELVYLNQAFIDLITTQYSYFVCRLLLSLIYFIMSLLYCGYLREAMVEVKLLALQWYHCRRVRKPRDAHKEKRRRKA